MKRRMNIALLVGMIETEFSREICAGAMLGAKEIDANLFILPGGIIDVKYENPEFDDFRDQYNALYSCVDPQSFDAVVIDYGSITSLLDMEGKKEFLRQLGNVPIMLIAADVEGYSSICIDNKSGIEEVVTHLVEMHHCSKIGFVSGPKTNLDAIARLEAYRETMQKYQLEVPEDWIIYGDFSEYHEDQMEEFILKNPELEAIVFANDQMALSGYKAMEKLHLTPGKDILITGFDDSSIAMMLEQKMTTVKVEQKLLAYRAVMECPKIIAGEEIHKTVKSSLVIRESCGCNDLSLAQKLVSVMPRKMSEDMIKQLADDAFDKYFNVYLEDAGRTKVQKIVEDYFDYYFHMVSSDGVLHLDRKEFKRQYCKYKQVYLCGYISSKQFFFIEQMLYTYLSRHIKDKKSRLELLEQITAQNMELIGNIATQNIVSLEKSKIFETVLTNIIGDMVQDTDTEQRKYEKVILKLQRLDFQSSCIFTYQNGIPRGYGERWKRPERLYIKAMHNRNEVHVYKEKEVKMDEVFSNAFIPSDRRVNMLVLPLFSNMTQYGLIMFESEIESIRYAMQIAGQISVSIEVLEIIEKQNAIKKALEENLAKTVASNKELDKMSNIDPLTGIKNRRGFYNEVEAIMNNADNYGKRGIAVYADMDNLKVINDKFGHEEGDFSLKAIAKILANSFRKSDVVGRLGGDEFAAFAIAGQEGCADKIRERMQEGMQKFNESCDKPYYVHFSAGIYEFIIDEKSDMESVLSEADTRLYAEKKHKNKCVYK